MFWMSQANTSACQLQAGSVLSAPAWLLLAGCGCELRGRVDTASDWPSVELPIYSTRRSSPLAPAAAPGSPCLLPLPSGNSPILVSSLQAARSASRVVSFANRGALVRQQIIPTRTCGATGRTPGHERPARVGAACTLQGGVSREEGVVARRRRLVTCRHGLLPLVRALLHIEAGSGRARLWTGLALGRTAPAA
jgi:hypothetical protein